MSLEQSSNPDITESHEHVLFEELQGAINDSTLDLPELRRDLSKEENVRWLLRNILIRNSDKVPQKILSSPQQTYKNIISVVFHHNGKP